MTPVIRTTRTKIGKIDNYNKRWDDTDRKAIRKWEI